MRLFFILLSVLIIFIFFTSVKEHMENPIDPKTQQGTINYYKNLLPTFSMLSPSAIQVLQDKSDKQLDQITRLEATVATLASK
jgi:hypothetical protein